MQPSSPWSAERSLLITAFAGAVHALDRASGTISWTAKPFGQSAWGTDSHEVEIAITNSIVICANHWHLAFLDYATGKVHTVVQLPHEKIARPTMIVDGPHVYVSGGNVVSCFTVRGHLLWTQPFDGESKTASIALGLPGNVRQGDNAGQR